MRQNYKAQLQIVWHENKGIKPPGDKDTIKNRLKYKSCLLNLTKFYFNILTLLLLGGQLCISKIQGDIVN